MFNRFKIFNEFFLLIQVTTHKGSASLSLWLSQWSTLNFNRHPSMVPGPYNTIQQTNSPTELNCESRGFNDYSTPQAKQLCCALCCVHSFQFNDEHSAMYPNEKTHSQGHYALVKHNENQI